MTPVSAASRLGDYTRDLDAHQKSVSFIRYLSCLHACRWPPLGSDGRPDTFVAATFATRFGRDLRDLVTKAATAPGTTSDATWLGPLAAVKPLADAFLEFSRPLSLIGRIPGLRRVPFNVSFPVVSAPTTAAWVGETVGKPTSKGSLATALLTVAKVSDIVVVTSDLMKVSVPNAETVLRDELTAAVNGFVDSQFIDPSKAASAGISPASITNGVTPITPSGTTTAALKADIGALIAQWVTNNPDTTQGVFLLPPKEATMLIGSMAAPTFDLQSGGTYAGFPVVVSGSMGTAIVLVDAHAIALADGGIELDGSDQALLQMSTTPSTPGVAADLLTSLWQNNLVALRCERFITWTKARANAVSLVSPTAYAPLT